MKVNSKYR